MQDDIAFASLVSLACHDLRTPLATAYGFARTLERADLTDPYPRYVTMIASASGEISEILDTLALAARLEAGRWEPALEEVDSGELARTAAARLDDGTSDVTVDESALVRVDSAAAERSLAALALCALRHGALDRVELAVSGERVGLAPVKPEVAPILLGEQLKDLGAAVAVRVLRALGGTVVLESPALVVTLPAA